MQDFGAKAAWTSPNSISVAPQLYQSIPFKVESDWSAASYWYQIAALSPKAEIELLGLFPNSYQGDSRGAEVFSRLGITTEFTSQGVKLKKQAKRRKDWKKTLSTFRIWHRHSLLPVPC